MLVLEIAFLFIMQNQNIISLNTLKKHFYTLRTQIILHFFLKTENL